MLQKSTELLREELKSISLKDFNEVARDTSEYNSAVVSAYYYMEPIINGLIQKQLELIITEVSTTDQLCFLQGTINGLLCMKDWFEEQKRISLVPRQEKENNKEL